MSDPTSSPPAPVRRVVTGHTPEGKSVIIEDGPIAGRLFRPEIPNSSVSASIYETDQFPSENTLGPELYTPSVEVKVVSKGGSTFSVIDFSPGLVTPFHRTISVDYAVVMKGSVVCVLDDNERVTLNEGDVLVQRGTIHTWLNESPDWARVAFVVLEAKPVQVGEQELPEEYRAL